MKRIIFALFVGLLVASGLTAQSITDNANYKRSLQYRDQSRQALAAGDYAKAYEFARAGITELDKYRANNGILLAQQQMRTARERGLDKRDPDLYARIVALVNSAIAKQTSADYVGSVADSDNALDLLKRLLGTSASGGVATYTVVSGDCLWRISAKPAIYNDKHAWPKIYMANKSKLRYPNNPNLIYPDQVFDIPR